MAKKDETNDEVASVAVDPNEQEIIVADPQVLRPSVLPLVVTLPEGASKAQIAYSKILNSYAYQNPEKWATKKDVLIQTLKDLKNAPDPVEGPLTIGTKANVL